MTAFYILGVIVVELIVGAALVWPRSAPTPERTPSPMSTETPETAKVPDELVATLGQRMYDASHESCDDYCHGAPLAMFETIAREHLAAVLPAHEAMVRADERRKAIEEINAKRDAIECNCADDRILRNGLWLAARILEGERP